jgi:hypothetical protein
MYVCVIIKWESSFTFEDAFATSWSSGSLSFSQLGPIAPYTKQHNPTSHINQNLSDV